ncbi:hypothetical protein [Qipengyuania sphaerica]|uniref:hypothetical protein n=1 Tax=Qipengyuania sphaerica TaxID=2867243 RepID=UPI001C878D8D|nr:hypothetical protein [Qipengyuania sphaerica]MBX7539667.1 hypothetical protein [Qipengyuania sphaerica]
MMLANMRNDWGVGGAILAPLFRRSRDRRLAERGDNYVEINPFLCPMTDLLPEDGKALHVVHMVREPGDWATSITNFKASTRFRDVIDHVPFAKPYPSPRPEGWSAMPEIERALWRWQWCNSNIAKIAPRCEAYSLVRYEHLFSSDHATVRHTVDTVSRTLGMARPLTLDPADLDRRANPSQGDQARPAQDVIDRICGPQAARYGY